MDLVTHIPGIVNSASFTPGAGTPAPYNVAHTGLTDGTSPGTASKNQAEIYNRWLLTQAAVIKEAGLTIDNTNWTQMATAITTLASAGGSGGATGATGATGIGATGATGPSGAGGGLPGYIRTYTANADVTIPIGVLADNRSWGILLLDATALINTINADDYDNNRTLLKAGTYLYQLSVPVKNNTSDTNHGTYTALVEYPPGGVGGSYVQVDDGTGTGGTITQFVSNPYNVISRCAACMVGDWQTATVIGIAKFTLAADTYVSPAVMTQEYNNMTLPGLNGFSTLTWCIWRVS